MDTPNSPGVYCRLSYAPDGSLEKVERQEADARAIGQRLNWPPITDTHVYSDNSRSAWQRNRKRPAWDRMLTDIETRAIDGLIVYHGDRLIRQPWDLELLLKLADERSFPLASVSGMRDLANEDDRYILRIEAAGACRASADTSRRVQRGWAARAQRGEAIGGGNRPFGFGVPTGELTRAGNPFYDTTRQVPEEAAVLREAAERLIAGQTLGGVLTWMNAVSTTSLGKRWNSKGLKNLLTSPRVAGLVKHKGQLYEAVWEPILPKDRWEDVKTLLQGNGQRYGYHGRERRYLLAGIAECCSCGSALRTKPSGGRNRKTARLYFCWNPACTSRVARNVEHLDAYVEGRMVGRLNEKGFLETLYADQDQPGVGAEIAALERRKGEAQAALKRLADHPDIDPELLVTSLLSYDHKITELREQMNATARQRLLGRMAGISYEGWKATPLDVRAETVRSLYRVIVLPATWRGPGFDTASVRLEPLAT